ncbi:MAG: CU044_2847 family protein [Thiobacillaceae bacterium]
MTDKSSQTYVLPSGAEIEIETLTDHRHRAGAADASFVRGDKILLDKVIEPLGEVAELLFTKIKSKVSTPDSVTLEFAASLKGQTKLLIVSGEGEGSIKVSLTWKHTAAEA